jgi:hypothetical protein
VVAVVFAGEPKFVREVWPKPIGRTGSGVQFPGVRANAESIKLNRCQEEAEVLRMFFNLSGKSVEPLR